MSAKKKASTNAKKTLSAPRRKSGRISLREQFRRLGQKFKSLRNDREKHIRFLESELQTARERIAQLEQEKEEAVRAALAQVGRDELTGLLTWTGLEKRFRDDTLVLRRRKREERGVIRLQERLLVSLLFLDLDHFKAINDTFGHERGDAALQIVAENLKTVFHRAADEIARVSGDEWAVVLQGTDQAHAYTLAEAFLQSLRRDPGLPFEGDERITASIGIVSFEVDLDVGIEGTISQMNHEKTLADTAMYHAKHMGRDQIVIWRPGMVMPKK